MRDELRGRLVQHPRLRPIARDAVVRQPPDAAMPGHLVQLVLFDLFAQIRALLRPLRPLDHAAIHVRDVDRAVRPGRRVGGTEQRVERTDELGAWVDILKLREALGLDRPEPADDASDHFAVEIVANQILRQPISTIDLITGGGRGVDQRAVGHASARQPRLDVADQDRRAPHDVQIRLELIRRREVAVVHRELEVAGHAAGATLEPDLAVVVLRHAPLGAVRPGWLFQEAVGGPPQAKRVDRAVKPVVHRPEQAGLLRFHVARTPEVRGEQLFLVGHSVGIGIGVLPHFVRVGLHRQDAVGAERRHEPREDQLVDEDGVALVHAVVVAILVHGDPADRRDQIDPFGRLKVAAQLDDEHSAVAVEGDLSGILYDRIGEHGLEAIAGREPEAPGLLYGRDGKNGRFWRQVGVRIGGVTGVGGSTRPRPTARRLDGSPAPWRTRDRRSRREASRRASHPLRPIDSEGFEEPWDIVRAGIISPAIWKNRTSWALCRYSRSVNRVSRAVHHRAGPHLGRLACALDFAGARTRRS